MTREKKEIEREIYNVRLKINSIELEISEREQYLKILRTNAHSYYNYLDSLYTSLDDFNQNTH